MSFLRQFDRNLWILSLGWFVGALGFAASIPFLSIYFHGHLGMSTTQIGLFFGAMAVVRATFQAIGGEMSDRVGRAGLLIHSQTIRGFTFLLLAWSIAGDWGFWPIAILVTVNSIFGAVFMPAINALVSDIVPKESRLDGYAITRAAGNFGWAAGPAIGGFFAHSSYASLFIVSGAMTFASALVFWLFFKAPPLVTQPDSFKLKDLVALKKDLNLARHSILIFLLYLVVAQMIAPFSVFSVEMIGISESSLGLLFAINGFMVTLLQIPVTRMLAGFRFTTQLTAGAFLYFIGYGVMGCFSEFSAFVLLMILITTGEIVMSPPALTLTSRLAPEGRMGRYMGVFGFFTTAGWSFGPLYGGYFLDQFSGNLPLAWLLISSLALVAAIGYIWFGQRLPDEYNHKD